MRCERLALRATTPRASRPKSASSCPPPESVRDGVALIVATVRAGGDRAVRDYSRTLDTGGREPQALLVSDAELDDALARLDPAIRHGIDRAIENVAAVAGAACPDRRRLTELGENRVVHRHAPVERAAVYVPGGRAPYPSTVVMGAVPARLAGVGHIAVCSPPRGDGDLDPVVLAACRLAGVDAVYRMGGAHAIAALAYGTATVPAVDVIVGPGNLYVQEAKRQVFGQVGHRRLRRPERPARARRPATPIRARSRSTCWPRPSTAPGTLVVAASDTHELLDAFERHLERGADTGAVACLVDGARRTGQLLALAQAFAPEHLQLVGADAEPLADRVTRAGCVFVGAGAGDRVRRLHRRLEPHPARRTAPPGSPRRVSPEHFRPQLQRGPHRARPAELAELGGAAGARRGLRAPRAIDGGTHSGEWEPMSRIGLIERKTARDRNQGQPRARRPRRRRARHRRRLLRPHARPAGPPRPSRPRRRGARRPRDRRPSHGRGRRDLHRPGARRGARRPRRDRPLRPGHDPDGRGARVVRDRHLRARPVRVRGHASAGRDRQLRPRARRGVRAARWR